MKYSLVKTEMKTINENGAMKPAFDERENRRLRAALQKAVRKEKAPESLRERIRRMIRE